MRVATLNLLYYPQGDRWRERRPLVEAELRALRPEVIGLQEVNRPIDQDHALACAAGNDLAYRVYRASETVRDRYPRHWDGVVMLVASTAGTIRFHEVRRLTHLRAVHAVGLRLADGATVTVANTHLHHPDGQAGRAARLRQARTVLEFLDGLPPSDATILAGDCNATPDEPALRLLFGAGFRSATREAGQGDPGTFPSGLVAPTIERGSPTCIDYLLVRGDVAVDNARLAFDCPSDTDAGLYPSDHRGLVADLTVMGRSWGSRR
jgi:endonuclease/exonuclease/phosphatase family metal-dependent hydrolase